MIRELFFQLPMIGRFAVVFGLILLLPKLAERLKLPGVVGLLLGGIVLGPDLLGLVNPQSSAIQLFAELGKLLLMFFAGYEVDLGQFRRVWARAGLYGALTFALPLAIGYAIAVGVGFGTNAAILIGSLLASHTLVGLPILRELDLMGRDAVVVTIGATIFTDVAAMLLLAVCLSVHATGFSAENLAVAVGGVAIYTPLVVFGLSALARWFVRVTQPGPEMRLGLLILIIAVAAEAAEFIQLEGIVGAFLTGLAVKRGVGETQAGGTLSVLSHTLFIPVFFLSIGFLVDLRVFGRTLIDHTGVVVSVVGGLLLAKYLAAVLAGAAFRMKRDDRLLMASLSIPQVAATLAAALVAYQTINAAGARLIDEPMLNTVVVLVLVTSILGPTLTRRVALRLRPGS